MKFKRVLLCALLISLPLLSMTNNNKDSYNNENIDDNKVEMCVNNLDTSYLNIDDSIFLNQLIDFKKDSIKNELIDEVEKYIYKIAPRAKDMIGRMLETNLHDLGLSTDGLFDPNEFVCNEENNCKKSELLRSAMSLQVIDPNGEHVSEVADTGIVDSVTPEMVRRYEQVIAKTEMVIIDSNLPVSTISAIADLSVKYGVPALYEPVCTAKAARIIEAKALHHVAYITPNEDEMLVLAKQVPEELRKGLDLSRPEDQCQAVHRYVSRLSGASQSNLTIFLKLGKQGAMISTIANGKPVFVREPSVEPTHYENVCGAGDSFVGGTVWNMIANHATPAQSIPFGIRAATLSLASVTPISPKLSPESIKP